MPHLAARTAQGLRPNSGDLAAAAAEMLAEGARDTQQQQLDQAEVGAVDMSILVSEEAAGGQAAKAKVACWSHSRQGVYVEQMTHFNSYGLNGNMMMMMV